MKISTKTEGEGWYVCESISRRYEKKGTSMRKADIYRVKLIGAQLEHKVDLALQHIALQGIAGHSK